jgi:hypothetical protein
MTPQSPVVEGLEPYEIILGADQPEYQPLPVLRSAAPNYAVLSRWVPTEEERAQIAAGADIFLTVHTFGRSFPPVAMEVACKSTDPEPIEERMQLDRELNERLRILFALAERNAAAQIAAQGEEQNGQDKSH